jgi:plasmid maintenance system antidote protein VapI
MELRLSDALGTTPEMWTGMQAQYDLKQASKKRRKKVSRLVAA